MTRKRKSLDESLATNFVYGTDEPQSKADATTRLKKERALHQEVEKIEPARTTPLSSPPAKTIAPEPTPTPKQSSLMEKLQIKAKEATTRFTVDLPDSMHRKLSILAAKTGRTKAEIVRMVLDEALTDVED